MTILWREHHIQVWHVVWLHYVLPGDSYIELHWLQSMTKEKKAQALCKGTKRMPFPPTKISTSIQRRFGKKKPHNTHVFSEAKQTKGRPIAAGGLPLHEQSPGTEQQGGETGADTHQPLQGLELDLLELLAKGGDLLLNLGLRLLDLELLAEGLLADAALFEVEVEADAGLGARDVVAQAAVELGNVVGQTLVGAARRVGLGAVGREQLGAQLGKVDLLRVRGLGRVLAEDHGAGEVLDAVS